jgi:MoaA/NifB/PqqE/SkfB family radical SAM enzyme
MQLSDNEYCNKLVSSGLTYATFSLHAPNPIINEAITNTPNSFIKTTTGIKNLIKHRQVEVNVVTAIQKINYQSLFEIGTLIQSYGVKTWSLCDLVPKGMAKEAYVSLCVRKTALTKILTEIISTFNRLNLLFYNFTYCALPKGIRPENIITIPKKCDDYLFVSYDKKGILKKSAISEYADNVLQKVEICAKCRYTEKCVGIWSSYLDIFGETEIQQLVKKNDCLIKRSQPQGEITRKANLSTQSSSR